MLMATSCSASRARRTLALLKGSPLPKIVATKMGLVIAGAISTRKSGIQVLAIGTTTGRSDTVQPAPAAPTDAPLIAATVPPFLVCISATQGNAVVVEVENDLKTTERFRGALDLKDVGEVELQSSSFPTTQGALALLSGTTPLVMMRVENGGETGAMPADMLSERMNWARWLAIIFWP